MSLSEWFEDEDVICQLRAFICDDEFDYENALSTVEDLDDENLVVVVKDRRFSVHKVHGGVDEL